MKKVTPHEVVKVVGDAADTITITPIPKIKKLASISTKKQRAAAAAKRAGKR